NLDKFESRCYDGIFLGYPAHSRGYRVFNLDTNKIVETYEVTFDEASPGTRPDAAGTQVSDTRDSIFVDDDSEDEDPIHPPVISEVVGEPTSSTQASAEQPPPIFTDDLSGSAPTSTTLEVEATSAPGAPLHVQRQHPPEQIIGNLHERVTRSRFISPDSPAHSAFVASFEPRDITHALSDSSWVNAMHEELENFERNKVWTLVEPPSN
ncbi:hypothetical protein JGD43_25750, partial [Salmonella enterica subsp. enterica serovar Goldcoast]|nr:hypothetical protein [Salmonella enterica subsp. enterica serovar Goldcoast]